MVRLRLALGAAMLACALAFAVHGDETFEVRLSSAPRDASMKHSIAGHGTVRVALLGSRLTLAGEFARFPSPATQATLRQWIERLRAEVGAGFPEKVTAFRPDMAVHGKYGEPCPDCGTPVQRIRYADNETNYCPRCQTGGKVLADRAFSRLLGKDFPRTIEELERLRRQP